MRLADDWDTITARRGAASAPAPDPWSQIESRRAADALPVVDAWSQIETRRAAEAAPAVSHAKTMDQWVLPLSAGGLLLSVVSLLIIVYATREG